MFNTVWQISPWNQRTVRTQSEHLNLTSRQSKCHGAAKGSLFLLNCQGAAFNNMTTTALSRSRWPFTQSPNCRWPLWRRTAVIRTHAVVVVSELKAGEAETVVGSHGVFTGTVTARLPFTLVDVWNTQNNINVKCIYITVNHSVDELRPSSLLTLHVKPKCTQLYVYCNSCPDLIFPLTLGLCTTLMKNTKSSNWKSKWNVFAVSCCFLLFSSSLFPHSVWLEQIKCALCDLLTHAHGLVSCGLKAVVADAAVTALRVDTLAVAAHVGDLLALVTVCGHGTTENQLNVAHR